MYHGSLATWRHATLLPIKTALREPSVSDHPALKRFRVMFMANCTQISGFSNRRALFMMKEYERQEYTEKMSLASGAI